MWLRRIPIKSENTYLHFSKPGRKSLSTPSRCTCGWACSHEAWVVLASTWDVQCHLSGRKRSLVHEVKGLHWDIVGHTSTDDLHHAGVACLPFCLHFCLPACLPTVCIWGFLSGTHNTRERLGRNCLIWISVRLISFFSSDVFRCHLFLCESLQHRWQFQTWYFVCYLAVFCNSEQCDWSQVLNPSIPVDSPLSSSAASFVDISIHMQREKASCSLLGPGLMSFPRTFWLKVDKGSLTHTLPFMGIRVCILPEWAFLLCNPLLVLTELSLRGLDFQWLCYG